MAITDRLYVATALLQGALSNPEGIDDKRRAAKWALEFADVLLSENKPTDKTHGVLESTCINTFEQN